MTTPNSSSHPDREAHPAMPRQPLGTVIFRNGLLTAEQLLEALEEGHRTHTRLGDILVERGWIEEEQLAYALAEQYGLPALDLEPDDVDPEAKRFLSLPDSERLGAIVIGFDDGAPVVAVSDPSNAAVIAELERLLGGSAQFVVAATTRIAAARVGVASSSDEPPAARADSGFDESAEPEHAVPGDEVPGDVADGSVAGPQEPAEAAYEPSWPPPFDAAATVFVEQVTSSVPASEQAGEDAEEPAWPPPFDALGPFGSDMSGGQAPEQAPEQVFEGLGADADEPVEAAEEPGWPPPFDAASTYGSDLSEGQSPGHVFDDRGAGEDEAAAAAVDEATGGDPVPAVEPEPIPEDLADRPQDSEAVGSEFRFYTDATPAGEPEAAPQEFEDMLLAPVGSYEVAPWPEAVSARELVAAEPELEPAPEPEPESEPAPPPAAELINETTSQPSTDEAQFGTLADEPEDGPEDHVVQAAAADAAEVAAPVALVLRLNTGAVIELGRFDEPGAAHSRAAALMQQLIADEPAGWTSIDGSFFRPAAIISVDVVAAAD